MEDKDLARNRKENTIPGQSGDNVNSTEISGSAEEKKKSDLATGPNLDAVAKLAQGTDHTPEFIKQLVSKMSPRWANWTVRSITTILMIAVFSFVVWAGPLALVFLVLIIQLACFKEIIHIGHIVYESHDLPWFRTLSWGFLFASNYFLFGESLITRFRILLSKEDFMQTLITHHRFISFSLYCGCVVGFVLSLVKKHYLKQFTLFGWTHVTLLIIVTSSHFMMQNIFNGLIWFLLPVSLVICNDIMAYVFGFFFGRTPLIQLSPKKTWEGFIGGGLSTLIFGLAFSSWMIRGTHFTCPIEYDDVAESITTDCVRNPVFTTRVYNVSRLLFMLPMKQITWCPFYWHSLAISLFTSIVGPFGGFFASGFKRAFKIKDFGDTLPGHGGIMDRFDCQIIIGTFVFFYYNSFIRTSDPSSLIQQIYFLPQDEQLAFMSTLIAGLTRRGRLPALTKMIQDQQDKFAAPKQ